MLHILLLVLKILGIILVTVLGILLVLILLVLFVPVRYRGDLDYHGKPGGSIAVSWLLHVINAGLSYDGSVKVRVKALGIRVFEETLRPEKESAEEESKKDDKAEKESIEEEKTEEKSTEEENTEEENTEEERTGSEQESDDGQTVRMAELPEKEPDPAEKTSSGFFESMSGACRRSGAAWDSIREKYEKARAFISDEENQKTFRLLFHQIKSLIKHVLPRKLSGAVRFGFDDPYRTGQVLTAISPFYGLYAKSVVIEAVFGETVLEGEIHIKGHIRAATLLAIVLRVFMNKNFRKLLRKWRK